MINQTEFERIKSDLILPWIVVAIFFSSLIVYLIVCHTMGSPLQQHWPEEQRQLFRTMAYVVAIITMPMTNLIRHIMVRLNQTMPGDKAPKHRYLTTIIVSMTLMESIGALGFVMYLIGDDFNTLYILIGVAMLGLFLYRPKPEEYLSIVHALTDKPHG